MSKKSNRQILTAAHDDFAGELSRYANLKLHNLVLSDDLVQTTFMKTWMYLQSTGKIDLMRAFLYHVLNRLIIDEYRKKKTISLDLLSEKGFELEASKPEMMASVIDARALTALIQKLPEKYRVIITMRYIKELSLKEMCVITKTSQNTMSVQLHRGLAKLKLLSAMESAL